MKLSRILLLSTAALLMAAHPLPAQKVQIPHAQDKPPGPALSPDEAIAKMTVPEGFSVECVASEPNIVNPVAMTIDERGRFWITESLEYPRKEAGPGRDRVKVLEDTDGDGKADKFTIFLDGLNIPSGVAVGHGGVWIANSPDIFFVPDADRDMKPDGPPQVVVTGFGRHDTHELPNSLTWGPDGWLYGLNGVFNFSNVTYPPDSPWLKHIQARGGRQPPGDNVAANEPTRGLTPPPRLEFSFTCAMFRIHPRTREFQVFAEGTSNPWGIAFNDEGEAFVSACVIDHLWHIVETGYYHRQGGPYPPFTWKIDSIVKHKHQKAAYCGIHYFDSDAYPEQYRGKLYMGNIHGGCINVDKLQRDGSTYFATGEPDFLTANDAWFMPVVQKTGPDGCLYILDWYDRYHCYQDANRDPAGIDRLKGRLYRVRYHGPSSHARQSVGEGEKANADAKTKSNAPRSGERGYEGGRVYPQLDLAKETDEQLIERLGANNDFIRWTATRLLQEKANEKTWKQLSQVADHPGKTQIQRRQGYWALIGMQRPNNTEWPRFAGTLDPIVNCWVQRTQFEDRNLRNQFAAQINQIPWPQLAQTPTGETPNGILQFVIGVSKLPYSRGQFGAWLTMLAKSQGDQLLPRVIWQNLHPRLEEHTDDFVDVLRQGAFLKSKPVADLMPRVMDRILGRQKFDAQPIGKLFALLRDDHPQVGRQVLEIISAKVQSGELKGEKLDQLKAALAEPLTPLLAGGVSHPLGGDAALLAVSWGDPRGLPHVRRSFATAGLQPDLRLKALNALIAAKDDGVLESVAAVLADQEQRLDFQSQVLLAIARLDEPKIADVVLAKFSKMEPSLQPSAIELLTQRASWSKRLLTLVGEKQIAATAINVNQARRMQALKDAELRELLNRHWGQVRDSRDPDREKVVAEMKTLIRQKPGDAFAGEKVFKRVCAACHKLYGEGPDIGPDITSNGRNDFNQLLSNVFDPSLVIGAGYRVCTVVTKEGRVQTGLLVEDSPQRVVLKPASVVPSGIGFQPVDQPEKGESSKEEAKKKNETKKDDRLEAYPTVQVTVGKLETFARGDIDEFKVSEISLMPEQLEKQLTPPEIVDLFAFITLDKHPSDKTAKQLPGVRAPTPRATTNPGEFGSLLNEVLPGFTTAEVGEGGLAILADHFGREGVLRTHPISRDKPCILTQKLTPPAGKKTTLHLDVSHDPRGDWRLVIRGNGERLADEMISKETCSNGWRKLTIDLSKFAGQELTVGLVNQANDWSYEFGYWGGARIISESADEFGSKR